MSDESQTTIGKRSKMTVGLAIGIAGAISWATAIKSQGDTTANRVTAIEQSRENRYADQVRHNTKVEKCLFAIMQRLKIPEPRD